MGQRYPVKEIVLPGAVKRIVPAAPAETAPGRGENREND
jgi:hypothetical protein